MPPIKRRYLPSLGAFATFEVAAKHLSFTLAAKELNVTQGAVSQQIRLLENALETQLFVRKHNALELTAEGRALFGSVVAGLDLISDGVTGINGTPDEKPITISATDGMARLWIRPLMRAFRDLHPDAKFVVLASDSNDTFRNYAEVDLSLICGNDRCEVGEEIHFLFPEAAQPVCSPAFLAQHGPFKSVGDLNSVNLLHLHDSHWNADAIGWQPLGWAEWFRAQGATLDNPEASFVTNKFGLLREAAIEGEGVMLGFTHLVADAIADGSLVPAHDYVVTAGRGNFLNCRKSSLARPMVAAFVAFLLDAVAAQNVGA